MIAYMVFAGWVQQAFWHFSMAYHGKSLLDQMFSVLKKLMSTHRPVSLPELCKLLAEGNSDIQLNELTTSIDVHKMTEGATFPSGIQDFNLWHFYNTADGVYIRARHYLAKAMNEPAESFPWCGTERGQPLLVLPHNARLPAFIVPTPNLSGKVKDTIDAVLKVQALFTQPNSSSEAWWRHFATRYKEQRPRSWQLPLAPFACTRPSAKNIEEVIKRLNLSLTACRRIAALASDYFFSSADAMDEISKKSDEYLRRTGLGSFASKSAALLREDADVGAIDEREKKRKQSKRVMGRAN